MENKALSVVKGWVWQRNDVFSVDGRFLGACLCREEASRGEAGGGEEAQVSAGQEGGGGRAEHGGVPWEVTSLQRCAPAGGLYPMGKGSLQEGMAPLDHSISTQRVPGGLAQTFPLT